MKTDSELRKDILAEFAYEPSVNAADIGVSVKEGIVSLNGSVSSYAAKLAAAQAAIACSPINIPFLQAAIVLKN